MVIELSTPWTVILNIGGWPIIQFGWALVVTHLPVIWFGNPRFFAWESSGTNYRRILAIRTWKRWLPDAKVWFGIGFSKKALAHTNRDYLLQFVREARRGEVCHLCAIASTPVFFLWNPFWGDLIMVVAGLIINLPCIASLRYARLRLNRAIAQFNSRQNTRS